MLITVIGAVVVPGFHQYDGAPASVGFLAARHRHEFQVKFGLRVVSDNREQEIFLCRQAVVEYLESAYGSPCEFGGMSCEMLAADVLTWGAGSMGMVWCEVWEEQTGGARVQV
jgi:hypothetical protein